MRAHFIFGLAALILAAGCSSSGSTTPSDAGGERDDGGAAPVDGATPEDGQSTGSDAASAMDAPEEAAKACNMLANSAPVITYRQVNQDPPAPQGGTMIDGTYAMTDASIYTGPSGPSGPSGTAQNTIQVTGGTIQVVSSGQPTTRTLALTTSGTGFTATDTCPDANVTKGSYTATATTILIFLAAGTDDAGARTLVETFTKQ